MSALIAQCLSYLRLSLKYFFPSSRHPFLIDRTPYGLPVPSVLHRTVAEDELKGRRLLVVGDVHGCYDELVQLLDKAGGRDPGVLVVFVGDVCNKGPLNVESIRLVREVGGYCVRGNHDEICLLEWLKHSEGAEPLSDKFSWLSRLSKEEMDWYFELPFSIHFPSREVLVIHAGLVPGVPIEEQSHHDLLHLRNVTFDLRTLTFSSERGGAYQEPHPQPWAQTWIGPDHVYFGHDAIRFLQRYPFATGLDTGCVYGGHLTAVFDDEREKLIQVKAAKAYEQPKKKLVVKERNTV
ncbi:PREDICTED: uncharacterized protein LOC100639940 [Amphimedon queenslandica]|uniref:Calcineurin-like phosphoesterase domain-containing protein n=1 Tax=Amphimedon queenslandica TaxID=400682 RepID=A0A1X7VIY8_AMPQE|nr:PREDICTED: uncharacterized protein LOC100639940 [Amphimedon queenslandica]|eukprot:XP_003384162.1 PREDICTED: uncharacterized protein LOC100639940 [Amphimedon queenslandica]